MEWLKLASELTLTAALVIATVTLWRENKALHAKLERLHAARLDDLKAMLKPSD